MVSLNKGIYLEVCMKEVPRLLSQLDKNEFSPTYGCFDRLYWHYRIRDYPATIPQYSTITLALLHTINSKENPWYKNKMLKKYSEAAMLFWTKMQNPNGSFNEAYPNDNSQPATAFSLYFVGEAYRLLKNILNDETKKRLISSMKNAARFVWEGKESSFTKRGDPEVPNHDAGSVNALYLMYQLTKKEIYKDQAKEMLNNLLDLQTKEGWFPEYGGADIGYSTFMLYWLTNYFRMSGDKRVIKPINKLVEFISYFIHPDGSLGGEYSSRSTYFYIPAGFEIAAYWNDTAKSIAMFMLNSIKKKNVLIPENFDDSNLVSFPFFTFLLAYKFCRGKSSRLINRKKLLCQQQNSFIFLKESKLLVFKNKKYYAIVSGNKGVIKIFKLKPNPKLIFTDTGWVGKGKELISSSILNPYSTFELDKRDNKGIKVRINTNFSITKFTLSSPLKMIISRAVFPLISEIPLLKIELKKQLRRLVITGRKSIPVRLLREMEFKEGSVIIKDRILYNKDLKRNLKLEEFYSSGNFNYLWSYPGGLFRKEEDLTYIKKKYKGGTFIRKIRI